MGLLSSGTLIINLDTTLENTVLAGTSPKGISTVMESFAADAERKNAGVLLIRNLNGGCSLTASMGSTFRMTTQNSVMGDSLDMFAGLKSHEYSRCLLELMDRYCTIDSTKRIIYDDYLQMVIELHRKKHVSVKPNELANFSVSDVRALNQAVTTDISERDQNELFLKAHNADLNILQSYFRIFKRNKLGELTSGTQSFEKVLDSNGVVEITLDFANNEKESVDFLDVLIDRLCMRRTSIMVKKQVYVIMDQVSNEHMIEAGAQRILSLAPWCYMMYSVTDISNLVKNSTVWVNQCTTMLCFRQFSAANMQYCSDLFGTHRVPKVGCSWFGRLGFNVNFVEEPIYKTGDFAKLPDNTAIFRTSKTGQHCRLQVY